jgi:hypothetical protein
LVRAKLQFTFDGDYPDLVTGEQVARADNLVMDLGAMPIPTGGYGVGLNAATYLTITCQAPTSGGDSIGVDWIQIMPAGHGLYRQLRAIWTGMGIEDGHAIVDDGIESLLYMWDSAGSNSYVLHRGIHAPLHVWPGVINRYRLMKGGWASIGAGTAFSLKAWYRARRLTL